MFDFGTSCPTGATRWLEINWTTRNSHLMVCSFSMIATTVLTIAAKYATIRLMGLVEVFDALAALHREMRVCARVPDIQRLRTKPAKMKACEYNWTRQTREKTGKTLAQCASVPCMHIFSRAMRTWTYIANVNENTHSQILRYSCFWLLVRFGFGLFQRHSRHDRLC